ncbi:MAG: hypothetical protein IT382_22425 [Deltaproteobacteria bacterium]|nr:hypothetical protein [Deltaproteobacteria bacterium]
MIRENRVPLLEGQLQGAAADSGMQSLDSCLLRLLQDGVVDADDALSTAEHPEALRRALLQLAQQVEQEA